MAHINAAKKAVDFLFVMNAAVTNIRLYPPTSAIIMSSVERMYKVLTETLSVVTTLEYAESEKSLLVQGTPLPEKEQKKPQISAFLELMLDMGIKSVSITRGITRKEISSFLQILGKTPGEILAAGGIAALVKQFSMPNIRIDEKIYVEMDSDHSILAGMDFTNGDFAKVLMGEEAESEEVAKQLQEIAQNPAWLSSIFQAGVKEVIEKSKTQAKPDLSTAFAGMIDALDGISDFDKREISKYIISSMSEMDDEVLTSVLTQNLETVFGTDFFRRFVKELDPEKFSSLFGRIKQIAESPESGNLDEDQAEAIGRVYDLLKDTEPGRQLLEHVDKNGRENDDSADPTQRLIRLKAALNGIIKGDTSALTDVEIAADIPNAINRLMKSGRDPAVERLVDKIGDALLNEDPEVREAVAGIFSSMDEMLAAEGDLDRRMALSEKLADWIKFETTVTPVYEKVTGQLQGLCRSMIEEGRADEAGHILEAYHLISAGNLKKDEAIKALAGNMLQNLATADIIDLLLKETKSNESVKNKDDIFALVILGSNTVERLLDRLYDSHNMSERNRIVQALIRMGKPVMPPIIERLRQDAPWFYIRNLVLLVGRIGDASHFVVLERLLGHSDSRVQTEAIKSIQSIGGGTAGSVLVKHVSMVEDSLKAYIVSILGAMKTPEAVPVLIKMLEDRSVVKEKSERDELKEKICEALGRIGARQGITVLEKIVRTKGLFGLPANSERVRKAAAKALANIKRMGV
ncbi:MAG: HEAT repeat domain-containing protein [Deltaproteobacteria bacterium]|nr:HEAT repeat domain-containing protein [Deltaproteobacteria bacterium]